MKQFKFFLKYLCKLSWSPFVKGVHAGFTIFAIAMIVTNSFGIGVLGISYFIWTIFYLSLQIIGQIHFDLPKEK